MSHLALPFFKNPPARPFWLFLFILSLWGCLQAQEFVQRHPKLWELHIVRSWGRKEQDQEVKSHFPSSQETPAPCLHPAPDPHPAALSWNLRNYISLSWMRSEILLPTFLCSPPREGEIPNPGPCYQNQINHCPRELSAFWEKLGIFSPLCNFFCIFLKVGGWFSDSMEWLNGIFLFFRKIHWCTNITQ